MAQRTEQQIQQDIQNKINQLIGEEKRLRQEALDHLIQQREEAAKFLQLERDIERQLREINKTLDYTKNAFDDLIEKVKTKNKALQFQGALLNKTNIITQEMLEIRKGETFADSNKINKLKQQNLLQIDYLTHLKKSNQLTEDQRKEIDREITELKKVDEEFEKINNHNKDINKGLVGAIPVIAKMASKLGISNTAITDAYQSTVKLGQGFASSKDKINAASVFAKELGANIKAALGPLAIMTFLAEQFISVFSEVDKLTGQLAKDFNITYSQASNLRSELNKIAGLSGETAVNTRALQESMVAVGQSLGSNAVLHEKDLVFMTKMREMAGFTNEELVSMQKLTLATGGNLEDNTKNLMFAAKTTALNNKVLLNEKDIFRDISKTSNAVKLSIYGGAEALGRAAAQAKALGLNLDQVNNIASGLLDFESSISAELEAQLLTGRDINLEQARLYALNNDVEGLSREIAKNVGSIADFNQMNRLQQEAVAKAVGMQREELATMLVDREALKNLSGKDAEDAKKALAAARARGMTEEEIADSNIQDLMKQQSLQDRFNQSVEKLKEIFVGVAQSLMPVLDALAGVLEIVNLIVKPFAMLNQFAGSIHEYLKPLVAILTAVGVRMAVIAIRAKATAAANIIGLSAKTFGLGAIIALAGAGAGLTYLESNTKFAEGGIVTKPITNATVGEAGPEAIIPLNSPKADKYLGTDKSNTVIAGTGLNNKTNTTQTDNSSMISELREIKNILQKTYNLDLTQSSNKSSQTSGASLAMNIDRLGTTISTNTYKTQ